MANFKKTAALVGSYVLVGALAIGGTVAFNTDRASVPNTFTSGDVDIELNEEFEQGAELIPNVNIEKKPTITNVGDSDAYVWLTFSIPTKFDNFVLGTDEGSNENMIHWNPTGATAMGYVDTDTEEKGKKRVETAVDAGILPAGTTYEDIVKNNKTWNIFNSLGEGKNAYQEEINGESYNTYVLLYNKAIEPGETTLPGLHKIFLDSHIDIAPDGEMYRVENGNAIALDWNVDEKGAPVIYVNAYGIQSVGLTDADKDGDIDVMDAYAAYVGQWGKLNAKNATVTQISDEAGLAATEGVAVVNEDLTLTGTNTTITASQVVLNANITAERTASTAADSAALNIAADTTLDGTGTVENKIDYCLNVAEGATVTINGGTYKGSVSVVQVSEGTLVINDGFFEQTGDTKWGDTFLLNCKDANYANGTASIIVKGGTFVNFNPADNEAETGDHINFVAAGYDVVSEKQANGDIWYTVVKAD